MVWRTNAACRIVDPNIFFDKRTEALAKSICNKCTVSVDCANEAYKTRALVGMWAGKVYDEDTALPESVNGIMIVIDHDGKMSYD